MSYSDIDKKRAYYKKRYRTHKKYFKFHARKYYLKNRDKINKAVKKWRSQNIEKWKKYIKKWNKNNIKKVRKRRNKWLQKERKECGDGYIKKIIISNSILKYSDIPQQLVEIKKRQIKLRRKLNELQCKMVER